LRNEAQRLGLERRTVVEKEIKGGGGGGGGLQEEKFSEKLLRPTSSEKRCGVKGPVEKEEEEGYREGACFQRRGRLSPQP